MKRIILFAFHLFLWFDPTYGQVNLTNGLVGKYCMDGDAVDESNNQNHGTNYGATASTDRFNNTNSALSFNGSSNYIQLSPNGLYNNNFTYSLWYYNTANPSSGQARVIFSVGGNICDQIIFIGNNYFSQTGIGISNYYSTTANKVFLNNQLPAINEWHHLVFVKTNDSIILYVDGNREGSTYAPNPPLYNGTPAGSRIAGRAGLNQYFSGKIDDVWIYNRALSYEEVRAIYNYDGQFSFSMTTDTFICGNEPLILDCNVDDATYLWSTGQKSKFITINDTGEYWVTVNKNCVSHTATIQVSRLAFVEIPSTESVCHPDSIELIATVIQGTIHKWSNSETTNSIHVKDSGVYWVEVQESGCVYRDSVQVTKVFNPDPLTADTTVCDGGSVILEVDDVEISDLEWSTGSSNSSITVNTKGKYWVNYIYQGCSFFDTINVGFTVGELDLGNDIHFCAGDTVLIHVSNPEFDEYMWSTGSTNDSILVTNPGRYWARVRSGVCVYRDTIELFTIPNAEPLGSDQVVCPNQNILLDASAIGSLSYLWSDNSTGPTLSVTDTGIYWVEFYDQSCLFRDSIRIISSGVALDLGTTVSICEGDSSILDAHMNGATDYLWSTGEKTDFISVKMPGIYTVSISMPLCTIADSVEVRFHPSVKFDFGNDTLICENTPLILSPGSFANYLWSDSSTQSTLQVTSEGLYWCAVQSEYCSFTDSILISIDSLPVFDLWTDTILCQGQTLNLDASISGPNNSYLWNTGSPEPIIEISDSGFYEVDILHTCGDFNRRIIVDVIDCELLLIPYAFSPNGDGINDSFFVSIYNPVSFHIRIFDRWGEIVYSSDSHDFTWDGTFKNRKLIDGIYLCMIWGVTANGKTYSQNVALHIIN